MKQWQLSFCSHKISQFMESMTRISKNQGQRKKSNKFSQTLVLRLKTIFSMLSLKGPKQLKGQFLTKWVAIPLKKHFTTWKVDDEKLRF